MVVNYLLKGVGLSGVGTVKLKRSMFKNDPAKVIIAKATANIVRPIKALTIL